MSYIYLDESGRFETNKARSVVGGFFCQNRDIEKTEIINLLKKYNIEQLHARDLNNSKLANIVSQLITICKDRKIEPIIIIPKRGFFVINDAITYINILADGISKLLVKKIGVVNDVTIVIEKRKTSSTEDYEKRVEEAIEKEKAINGISNKIRHTIVMGNKNDVLLQVADAIVHTFFRLDNDRYFDDQPFDEKVANEFKEWVEPYKLYLYTQSSIKDTILDMLNDGDYHKALMKYVEYKEKDKSVERITDNLFERLCLLPQLRLNVVLQTVLNSYYDAINIYRKLNEFEYEIIKFLEEILPLLSQKLQQYDKKPQDIEWAYCYGYMILLTLYNHKGDIQKFESVYNDAIKFLEKAFFDLDTLPYYIRIRVLRGVHLTNQFAFLKAYEQMSNLEKNLNEAFAFISEVDNNIVVKPRIVGEIIGTQLQALMYHTLFTGGNWEEVQKLSDKTIESFLYSDDKNRQYQYRAQIETYAGNLDKAREYLAKSIQSNDKRDDALLHTILQKKLSFELLHLLRIWYVEEIKNAAKANDIYDVLTQALSQNAAQINEIMGMKAYPIHTILRYLMVLYGLRNSKASIEKAEEFFEKANMLFKKDETITIRTLQVALYYDYIWVFEGVLKKDIKEYKKQYFIKIQKLQESTQGLAVHDYINKLKKECNDVPAAKWNTMWYLFPF